MSIINHHCPECGKRSTDVTKRCTCGWLYQSRTKTNSYQCDSFVDEEQCSMLGTISVSVYAKSAWYCMKHWEERRSSEGKKYETQK